MKNRFKFLCALFCISFILVNFYSARESFPVHCKAFMEGYNSTQDTKSANKDNSAYEEGYEYGSGGYVALFNTTGIYPDSIYDKVSGKKYAIEFGGVRIHGFAKDKYGVTSESKHTGMSESLSNLLMCILTIVMFLGGLYTFVIIFRTIRRINRGDIFTPLVEKSLFSLGILLIAYFVVEFSFEYVLLRKSLELFSFENYEIVAPLQFNSMHLLSGIGLLIVSEILKIGRKMKEEQELTI